MSRRFSSTKKGKAKAKPPPSPPRTGRVKADLPNNTSLQHHHSLTFIGRLTNPKQQRIWSLIPFLADHWKLTNRPIGADLGQGKFQFQFSSEEDIIKVLENRPFHFAKWMVILQRWEPTLSPSFPSQIPFWIRVQDLPVHLWTENIIKSIGQDIGYVEKVEITFGVAKMRVIINGLKPLIKSSVVEFPNGDEVIVKLVYEKLEKHCVRCKLLSHEVKDCPDSTQFKRQREPVMLTQQQQCSQSANTNVLPVSTMNPSFTSVVSAGGSNWYPTSRSEAAQSNGYLPTRTQTLNDLNSNNSHRTVGGSVSVSVAPAASLGLFSRYGSVTASGSTSRLDWNTDGSIGKLDYSHIDWSLDKGLTLKGEKNALLNKEKIEGK